MLVKLLIFMVLSFHKGANYTVSLQVISTVVLNTVFSGVGIVVDSAHLIGGQAIDPLFNYFTPTTLLTINYLSL